MHYQIDMITHDTTFVEPVSGTGGSKVIDPQIASELSKQAEWNRADMIHQSPDHRHVALALHVHHLPTPNIGREKCIIGIS